MCCHFTCSRRRITCQKVTVRKRIVANGHSSSAAGKVTQIITLMGWLLNKPGIRSAITERLRKERRIHKSQMQTKAGMLSGRDNTMHATTLWHLENRWGCVNQAGRAYQLTSLSTRVSMEQTLPKPIAQKTSTPPIYKQQSTSCMGSQSRIVNTSPGHIRDRVLMRGNT